jgi:nudix-type nucleoside diphosphatase (YffH/AdpP family)
MTDKIKNIHKTLLSDNWYVLNKYSFDYLSDSGEWQHQEREVYDRGNGAVVLLYDLENRNVILVKQFRIPTYVNGNADGMLLEACAGLLDADDPITCVIRETEEETGYRVATVNKVFESYMSPGAVTEILHFFIAAYNGASKVSDGGGLDEEHENIEVIEISFDDAYSMIASGEITDAKTIMLLQYAKLHLFN